MHRDTPQRRLALRHRPCPVCGADGAAVVARGLDYEYQTCKNELTFVQCEACATLYLDPRPAREDFDVIYPQSYYTNTEAEGGGAGAFIRFAWERLEGARARPLLQLLGHGPKRVLDVGCGDGRFLRVLRRAVGPDWELTGVERHFGEAARRRAARLRIELLEGDYETLELAQGQLDLVIAQQMIEHATEPRAVLARMSDQLRPGGLAVIDTPSCEGLDRRIFGGSLWGGYHFPRHLTLFTPQTLARLAGSLGLDVVEARPLLSPVFWIMTAHNAAAALGLPRLVTSRVTYRSLPLMTLATALDLPILLWSGQTSNMRVILRKPRS